MKWLLACLCCLAGCADLPRDAEGTLDRVTAERRIRVGVIAPGAEVAEPAIALLQQLEQSLQLRPELESGAAEPLLARVENGELDLVIGPFAPDTPWAKRVHLMPLAERIDGGDHHLVLAAARNGENAWIARLEPAATAVRAAR